MVGILGRRIIGHVLMGWVFYVGDMWQGVFKSKLKGKKKKFEGIVGG